MDSVNEWSHEFDLAYDNITSGRAPGLVPYEKSVFLTEGQENVVVALYKGHFGDSFEATEEVTSYLNTIIDQCTVNTPVPSSAIGYKVLSDKSKVYSLTADDVLYVTLEECKINTPTGQKIVQVEPVTQDEYFRTIRNPFKKQNANRVLRLSYAIMSGSSALTETRYSELISDCDIVEYTVRYIKRPEPIIIETLTGNLKINGKQIAQTCTLPKAIHRLILAEAVRLAKAKWNS